MDQGDLLLNLLRHHGISDDAPGRENQSAIYLCCQSDDSGGNQQDLSLISRQYPVRCCSSPTPWRINKYPLLLSPYRPKWRYPVHLQPSTDARSYLEKLTRSGRGHEQALTAARICRLGLVLPPDWRWRNRRAGRRRLRMKGTPRNTTSGALPSSILRRGNGGTPTPLNASTAALFPAYLLPVTAMPEASDVPGATGKVEASSAASEEGAGTRANLAAL